MKCFSQLRLIPAVLCLVTPMIVEAGDGNNKDHHDHHGSQMDIGESYPSTIFMGKTTFVVGGVDGVSDSGMGGMSTSEEENGTVSHYEAK